MRISFNDLNLKKHNVSRQEIDEVLQSESTIDIVLPPSQRGNDRVMYTGFTLAARLLEVGIEYFNDEYEHVFHAADATGKYIIRFESRTR